MNRERVQELYNMMTGVPARRMKLNKVFAVDEDTAGSDVQNGRIPTPTACGAIACMAGWAWIYPPFVEAGIREYGNRGDSICVKAGRFFGVNSYVFAVRNDYSLDDQSFKGTDKEVALRRLEGLLKPKQKQPDTDSNFG